MMKLIPLMWCASSQSQASLCCQELFLNVSTIVWTVVRILVVRNVILASNLLVLNVFVLLEIISLLMGYVLLVIWLLKAVQIAQLVLYLLLQLAMIAMILVTISKVMFVRHARSSVTDVLISLLVHNAKHCLLILFHMMEFVFAILMPCYS